MVKKKYTRKELIQICEDAVVPYTKWSDRDSYSAQMKIHSIYAGLTGGVSYTYSIEDNRTIWITFKKPTNKQKSKFLYLNIDSREDYFEWYKKEYGEDSFTEMFDGNGINWDSDYLGGYMPTRDRLIEVNGEDWY